MFGKKFEWIHWITTLCCLYLNQYLKRLITIIVHRYHKFKLLKNKKFICQFPPYTKTTPLIWFVVWSIFERSFINPKIIRSYKYPNLFLNTAITHVSFTHSLFNDLVLSKTLFISQRVLHYTLKITYIHYFDILFLSGLLTDGAFCCTSQLILEAQILLSLLSKWMIYDSVLR